LGLSQPLGHNAAGKVTSIKNSKYTIRNRNCELLHPPSVTRTKNFLIITEQKY